MSQLEAYSYSTIFIGDRKERINKLTVAFQNGWLLVKRIFAMTSPEDLAGQVYFTGIKYSPPNERHTLDAPTHLQLVEPEFGERLQTIHLIGTYKKCKLNGANQTHISRNIVSLPNTPLTTTELLPFRDGGIKRLVNIMYKWS